MASNVDVSEDGDILKHSTLYQEFQAERNEIMRHKWIESEKAGYDIGFERALTDWIVMHRAKWRKSRQSRPNPERKEESHRQEKSTPPEGGEGKEDR